MVLSLSGLAIDLHASFEPTGATLTRLNDGLYVNGVWQDGTPLIDAENLPGTIYAISLQEFGVIVKDTPDAGLRMEEMLVCHTPTELVAMSDSTKGDLITYRGNEYRIFKVHHRFEGDFHRAILRLEHANTNAI